MGWEMTLLNEILDNTSKNRSDIKREIEDYKDRVERTMRTANNLREGELAKKQKSLEDKSTRIQEMLTSHMENKKQLLNELGTNIGETLTRFKNFNIDQYVIVSPDVSSSSGVSVPSFGKTLDYSCAGIFVPTIDIFSLLNLFDNPKKDLEKVKEAYEKAQKYLAEVQQAIARVENLTSKLDAISNVVEDEKNTLNELMGKIRKIMPYLEDAMTKQKFRRVEAEYLKKLANIAEILKSSMENGILDNDGNVTDNYHAYLAKVKELNAGIPQEPKIETERTFFERLVGW